MNTFKIQTSNVILPRLIIVLAGLFYIFFPCFTVYAEETISLKAETGNATSVLLTWQSDSIHSVYLIQRSDETAENFTPIATLSDQAGVVSCYDTSAVFGSTYHYRVAKIVDKKPVLYSNIVKITVTLARPKNITFHVADPQVTLQWDDVREAAGYEIYRSAKMNKGYKKIGKTVQNKYTDKTAKYGHIYYYKITSVKTNKPFVCSDKSDTITVCIPPVSPFVTGFYAKKKIKLTWDKSAGADTYYIYKENMDGEFEKIGETVNLYFLDKKVKKGKTYRYKITASYKKEGEVIESSSERIHEVIAADINPKQKMVALTYDDGPGPYTNAIVNCLKQNNAKATFFVVGYQVDSHKKQIRTADKAGCEIGNHSYNHPRPTRLSEQDFQKQIDDTDQKIRNITGKTPALLRTPYGETNAAIKNTVGKPIILWSIDTLDWKTRNRDKTVNAVVNHVKDGDIVLMHDIHEPTKNASLILIPRLRKMGYQLVTVSELAQYRGYQLKKGTVYYNLRRK